MLLLFLALMIGGAVMLVLLNGWIDETRTLALHDPDQAARQAATMLTVLGAAGGVAAIGFGGFAALLGLRTLRANRFPPPGTRVVRDTIVTTGDPARRRGTLFVVLAAMLIAAGAVFPFVIWRMVHVLGRG